MAKNYIITQEDVVDNEGGSFLMGEKASKDLHLANQVEIGLLTIQLEDEVLFPYMGLVLNLRDEFNILTAERALKENAPVFFFMPASGEVVEPQKVKADTCLDNVGVVGYVSEVTRHDNGTAAACVLLGPRAICLKVKRYASYLRADVQYWIPAPAEPMEYLLSAWESLKTIYLELANHLPDEDKKQLNEIFSSITDRTARKLYFMMQNSPFLAHERLSLLEAPDYASQIERYYSIISQKKEELGWRAELHGKTVIEMGNRQREEFMRLQLQQIKNELGETDDSDEKELRMRASTKEWNEETGKRFMKELHRLERLNPASADYAVQYSYLDTYLDMPWDHCDNSDVSLSNVEETLNRDHYGLEKVKERIIEQMAVLKLRKDTKSPILCLYGPPGVGKTSLGKSIAEALGRKYVRVALGGLHDEAEIRGHRRTYLGSMPGRILSALAKCGTSDPVMVLDEVDKIGEDYKGDPQQALLEVLDPEQNFHFHDNYIDQDYDLSKVLFIATANSLNSISAPLLDRMELIEISGYIEAEKIEIAKRHIVRKSLEQHGFKADEITFGDDALAEIIRSYTRESGVRRMEKKINEILRKLARLKASDRKFPVHIDAALVKEYLGKPETFNDEYENNDLPGIVTGLAWTSAGGEILFIESSVAPGKEFKLVLTGNLGDVMKESAMLAMQYIKANQAALGLTEKDFEVGTVHVHVPEGAVPKDGPSAGITIATSLASTFTGRKVRSRLAMTGEITLRGKVLPVGGIKEKILAAKRAGIKSVLLSEKNRKDIEEIKPEYLEGLEFKYVDTIKEALDYALLSE